MSSRAIFFLVTSVLFAHTGVAAVRSSVDLRKQRLNFARETSRFSACPLASRPVVNLKGVYFYTDRAGSDIDEDLYRKANQSEVAIRNYTRTISGISNDLVTVSSFHGVEKCLVHWLVSWASANALLGDLDDNAKNYRIWAAVPILQSAELAFEQGELSKEDRTIIKSWVMRLISRNDEYAVSNLHNNLLYWHAAGLSLASVLLQDTEMLLRSMSIASRGINSITSDGFLPGELNRKARALEYHAFALDPLAIVSEICFANGVDMFHLNNDAMLRVGINLLRSEKDTSIFDAKAGQRQRLTLPVAIGNYGWSVIFLRHYNVPAIAEYVLKHKPIVFDRMGGNMTLLYGK